MKTLTIYHNPRCSTSRKTLELIRERGIEPEIILYLESPPSLADLKRLLSALGLPASKIVRVKEAEYAESGLTNASSDTAILKAISKYPKLLERPIVTNGERAVLGRPPENIITLLRE